MPDACAAAMPDAAPRADGAAGRAPPLKTSRFKVPGEGSSVADQRRHRRRRCWCCGSLVTNLGWVKPLFLPTPQAVFAQFYEYVGRRSQRQAAVAALRWRACSACSRRFSLACVTAIPIGIAMGMSRVARGIFDPPLEFYRPLPPLAYLPLIIIWFGIDELPKVLLIFLALLRAARARRARRRAPRVAGADQRGVLDGRELRGR